MMILPAIIANAFGPELVRRPFLSPIFSDHMVLQRDTPNKFWGWTEPGEQIRVTVGEQSAVTVAGKDGKWSLKVQPPQVGGPYEVKISGSKSVVLRDVLVGDVWVCGGQSNMQFGVMGTVNGQKEIEAANHPLIRFSIVPTRMSFSPLEFTPAPWQVCSSATIGKDDWNGLTAVGYFFAREVQKQLKIPIGLVHDCRGGSAAESWISRPELVKQGSFGSWLESIDSEQLSLNAGKSKYFGELNTWLNNSDAGSKDSAWASIGFDDSAWDRVQLPASYADMGFPWHIGVTWFRKEVSLSEAPGEDMALSLGVISGMDTTWVNGVQIGSTYSHESPRLYYVPRSLLKGGKKLSIAVRVLNRGYSDGFMSSPELMTLRVSDNKNISLVDSPWKVSRGPSLWSGKGNFPWGVEANYNTPSVHHNGMINPIAGLSVKGAIWYQGEANAGGSRRYINLMQIVAKEWRRAFENRSLPFYQVQLANFMKRQSQPGESSWAALREAQSISAKLIPNGGLVTAVDIGDADDIHPRNKRDVGLRLANLALRKTYGLKTTPFGGPELASSKADGSSIRLKFRGSNGALKLTKNDSAGFAIAGEDQKFVWAYAKLVGNEVVINHPSVMKPVAVRYGWADNPELTLFDSAGLPAFPFRTDNWPVN